MKTYLSISLLALLVISFPLKCLSGIEYSCPKSEQGSVHGNKGALFWSQGKNKLAEEETKVALKYDPDCSMWHQNLGFILESKGMIPEAIQSWLQSIKVNNDWCTSHKSGSYFKLGLHYYKQKQPDKSISYFEKAIALGAKEDVNNKIMSLAYLYLSYNYAPRKEENSKCYDLKKAAELKEKAYKYNPHDTFIKASMTKIFVLQNKIEKAQTYIAEIIEEQKISTHPNPGVYSYLAHIYSLLNDSKNSAIYMNKAIKLDPNQAKYLLSEINGDFKEVSQSIEMQRIINALKYR